MLIELVDSQFRPSRFPNTFAKALTYVTLTLTLPNALFTFLAFPKQVRALWVRCNPWLRLCLMWCMLRCIQH